MSEEENKPDGGQAAAESGDAAAQADLAAAHLAERAAKQAAKETAAKQTVVKETAKESADESAGGGGGDSELEKAKGEAAQNHDLYLRAAAEAENLRKRAEEQIAAAAKFAIEQFAGDIVEVRDALESALADKSEAACGEGEKLRDGFELIRRKLADAMARHKILEVAPAAGAPFDPHLHQAIGVDKNAEAEADNTVARLVAKGYTLHGRLLRPAAVIVAQAGE